MIRRFLWALVVVALTSLTTPCYGQAVTMTGAAKTPGGYPLAIQPTSQFVQSCNGGLGGFVGQDGCTAPGGAGSNPSVSTTGTTAPASGTLIGVRDAATGFMVPACGSANGVLCSPQAGTANRVITHTNLTLNTSTTICPAATNPVTTEIFFTTAGVGINLQGGTLTQATVGASTTTTPNIVIATANTYYLAPVALTNAITAYGAAGYIVCIQTTRP